MLGSQALSSFGSAVSSVALAIMVYQLTGSVLHMGAVMAVSSFPLIVTSWIGGALLDRFSAKWMMVVADAARAVLIFLMPFLAGVSTVFIYVIACLVGMFSAVFNPGQIKLTSELVDRDDLVKANSYLSVAKDGTEWLGYLAGGVLVYAVGYKWAFAIDAASYVASGLLLMWLPRGVARVGEPASVRALIAESPAVFMRMWRHPQLRTNMLFAVFPVIAVMMSFPISYGLVLDVFGGGSVEVGILEAAIAAGLIAGALLMSRMSLKGDKNAYVLFSLIVVAACLVGIRFSEYLWLSVALMGVAGIANVGMFVPSITMFQELPADADKGRLLAVRGGFGQIGATIGYLVGGVLGEAVGILQGFLTAGLLVMALSVIIYVPYRIGATPRARAARNAALARGASRCQARDAAFSAAVNGKAHTPAPVVAVPSGDPVDSWTRARERVGVKEKV
jgi:predicted MFS family arabinose efflux permease